MKMQEAIVMTSVKNDHTFRFEIPKGAQYGEAYDAAFEVLVQINTMAQAAAEALKPAQGSDNSSASVAS